LKYPDGADGYGQELHNNLTPGPAGTPQVSLHSGFRQLNHAPDVLCWRVGSAPGSRCL